MITGGKWVKFQDDKGTVDITEEITRLQFLDFVEEDVEIVTNTQEIKGTDGVLTSTNTFQPFKLVLRFAYTGHDIKDYHLFKTRIRGIVFKRKAYYVIHSDFPGRRYAVLPEGISYEDKYGKNGEVTITFQVVKGYSESLKDTSDITFLTDYWQFENGVLSDNIQYKFNSTRFSVWNGSTDQINAEHRHELVITVKGIAENGITIINNHNGTTFKYYKPLEQGDTLKLDGVHPFVNGDRVGINTNYSFIKLEPEWNGIEIIGLTGDIEIEFKFRFIYR